MKNTGYIQSERNPKDWIFGSSSQIPYQNRNTSHVWLPYLSPSEKQSGANVDAMDCVSFAKGQDIDAQINFLHASGLIRKEDWQKLIDLGFIINGNFVCSKRFIAITSKTTPAGNSFGNVAEAVRSYGLLPEKDLPSEPLDMTWEEYYRSITSGELNKSKEILKIFTFPYHYLDSLLHDEIEKALQMAPVQIATAVCPNWDSGDVMTCAGPAQHSTLIYDIEDATQKYLIQDHYVPFLKKLDSTYGLWAAMQTVVSPVVSVSDVAKTVPNSNPNLFNKDIKLGDSGSDVIRLKNALDKMGWHTGDNSSVYDDGLASVVRDWQKANLLPSWLNPAFKTLLANLINLNGHYFGPASRTCLNGEYDLWK